MNPSLSSKRAVPVVLLILIPLFLLYFRVSAQTDEPSNLAELRASLDASLRSGRVMQALYHVEALANETGWTAELAWMAGGIWEGAGDLTRAVAYWEVAADAQPNDVALTRQLAMSYITLQRWQDARHNLRRLVALTPEDNWAQYYLALLELDTDEGRARERLENVIASPLYGDTALALLSVLDSGAEIAQKRLTLGAVLAAREVWPFAERLFAAASTPETPLPEALAYAGLARDRQGKDGSVQIAEAIALSSDNAQVRYLQGLHLRTVGDELGSREAFESAVALDPLNPAYAAELGTAFQRLGNLPAAENWLKSAVESSGDDPRFQELLADFYAATLHN